MKLIKRFIILAVLLAFGVKGVAGTLASYDSQKKLDETIQQAQTDNEELLGTPVARPVEQDVLGVSRTKELPDSVKSIVPDFDALNEINADVVAWIYIPAVDISYPVVQGSDNETYTKISFDGSDSHTGAVFMNTDNAKDFSDENTFIFAHNMKNGSMFGNLKSFVRDESTIESPYIWIFTPDHAYQYEIFAAYTTTNNSDMYVVPYAENHNAYVEKALSQAQVTNDCDTTGKLLTLSTCSGLAGSGQRLLVHGSLVDTY